MGTPPPAPLANPGRVLLYAARSRRDPRWLEPPRSRERSSGDVKPAKIIPNEPSLSPARRPPDTAAAPTRSRTSRRVPREGRWSGSANDDDDSPRRNSSSGSPEIPRPCLPSDSTIAQVFFGTSLILRPERPSHASRFAPLATPDDLCPYDPDQLLG